MDSSYWITDGFIGAIRYSSCYYEGTAFILSFFLLMHLNLTQMKGYGMFGNSDSRMVIQDRNQA